MDSLAGGTISRQIEDHRVFNPKRYPNCYPSADEPGVDHWVRIRPPLAGQTNDGYRYFFKDGQVVAR